MTGDKNTSALARRAREWRAQANQRARGVAFYFHTDTLELALACFAIAWGGWVLLPFDAFASSATFALMAKLAPEWAWGITLLALGAAHFAIVLVGAIKARRAAVFVGAFAWTVIALIFILSNPLSTATVTYSLLAILNALAFLRLGGEL